MQDTIRVNNRTYHYYAWESSKESAKRTAKNLRNKGFGARVLKGTNIHHETIYRIYKSRADKT